MTLPVSHMELQQIIVRRRVQDEEVAALELPGRVELLSEITQEGVDVEGGRRATNDVQKFACH